MKGRVLWLTLQLTVQRVLYQRGGQVVHGEPYTARYYLDTAYAGLTGVSAQTVW